MRRTDQRRAAVFALYQHDLTGNPVDSLLPGGASAFTRSLVEGVAEHAERIDSLIDGNSNGWPLDRIAPLERAIMRVAVLEILEPGSTPGESPIPPEGAVDEAVETAKVFCGSEAPGFVNGILAAVIAEAAN